PVIAMLALASIGGGFEAAGAAADARAYPMPGQLIDVGGHRLHLNCTGSGSPTVVLEPGAGAMSSALGWITPAVARDTRVCVYDRAGRGWSEPADGPPDGLRTGTDLHTLLQRGQVPGPYVLAGHSFGGLYALTFAARYPDEVARIVLSESPAPASRVAALGAHSFGGPYALTFPARYPDEVAGMVLIDSTAPASRVAGAASSGDRTSYDGTGRVSALARGAAAG